MNITWGRQVSCADNSVQYLSNEKDWVIGNHPAETTLPQLRFKRVARVH